MESHLETFEQRNVLTWFKFLKNWFGCDMAEREKQEEQLGAAVCWQILNNWSPYPVPPPPPKQQVNQISFQIIARDGKEKIQEIRERQRGEIYCLQVGGRGLSVDWHLKRDLTSQVHITGHQVSFPGFEWDHLSASPDVGENVLKKINKHPLGRIYSPVFFGNIFQCLLRSQRIYLCV